MKYYYGYIEYAQDFGFLEENNENITPDMVEISEEEHNQLLLENSQGRMIVLYEGQVFTALPNQYIQEGNHFIVNPNYEQQQADLRRAKFYGDFFQTSLGFIRRKVSMKTGETKDFLTDLLPVISMAVSQGQAVNIITYREPDFTQEVTDWESLQTVKIATPQFIQECFNQVSTDFTGL